MKRFYLYLCITLVFAILFSVPVYATNLTEYELEELDSTVPAPSTNRKSLLQESIDLFGTEGLNQKYLEKSLATDGGRGALATTPNSSLNVTGVKYGSRKATSSYKDYLPQKTTEKMSSLDNTPTSAFTYTDSKTQATFAVPENWVETPLSTEWESIDVKFMSQIDEGMCIMYGNQDLWSAMSDDAKSGLERSDINNSIFEKSDLADVLGLSADAIQQITYGGKE